MYRICMPTVHTEQSNCKEKWCGVLYKCFFSDNYKEKNVLVLKIQQYS